jgi:hypothetical protein
VATVAFSPTAQRLASVSAGELALWSCDAQTVFKDTVSDVWPLWHGRNTGLLVQCTAVCQTNGCQVFIKTVLCTLAHTLPEMHKTG